MTDQRERNDHGQFVETITPDDVIAVIRETDAPVVTAKEVGEQLGCTAEAARQKLLTMLDHGTVKRRKVGAGAVVWWLVDEAPKPAADFDPDDPLFADPPTFASGRADVSRNVDEYVAEAVAAEHKNDT